MEISGVVINLFAASKRARKKWNLEEAGIYFGNTRDNIPKKFCMNLWGEKVDEIKISVGDKNYRVY